MQLKLGIVLRIETEIIMIDVFRKLQLVANVVANHEPLSYLVLSTLITQNFSGKIIRWV